MPAVLLPALPAAPQPASAAGLTEVTYFGSNPGNLRMFTYVPEPAVTGPRPMGRGPVTGPQEPVVQR